MTSTALHRTPTISLAAEGLVAADGSIWSHAATLGTRFKGSEFTIDRTTVENFIRNFTSGYPRKVPVDYEHGTTNGATTEGRPVPKAGDVLELRGVFAPADFNGELKTAAEKLSAKAGRAFDDASNLGLWMRWRPTRRALGMIQDGEYSELSIAFDENYPDNTTGTGQGPTLLAVALTNLPFLDDMLPVAASRDLGGPPADIGQKEFTMSNTKMLAATAALIGKPVSDDEQGATELTALSKELPNLRSYAADVGAELGETDPAKAVAKLKELKSQNAGFQAEAEKQKKARIATDVEATLVKHEKRLTKPTREYFGKQLSRELEAGVKLEESETLKAIAALPETGITDRSTGADVTGGEGSSDPDAQLHKIALSLMESDAEIKALAATDRMSAYDRAVDKAAAQIGYKSQQLERVRSSMTVVS